MFTQNVYLEKSHFYVMIVIKGSMHRHSPRRGFFQALFFTSAVLVASSSYIELSSTFFTKEELIVYLFHLPLK